MVDSLAITFHPSISGLIQGGEIKSDENRSMWKIERRARKNDTCSTAFDSIDSGGTKIRNFNFYDEVLGNSFSTGIEENREKWSRFSISRYWQKQES